MIYGIGTDLVEVERIKKELASYGEKFMNMLFTESERIYCTRAENLAIQAQCFAARFAAKEAFLKALGSGLRGGLKWKDVEVVNNGLGKPELHMQNTAKQICDDAGINKIHVSLSHTKESAIAVVILEKLEIEIGG
ncbi:MAG: holo-ACP synthase [Candidatus Cloacimonetes bacterium]|nr:holo-ACP synthase [Candidatus Cloacimonadota bacterium]